MLKAEPSISSSLVFRKILPILLKSPKTTVLKLVI